MSAVVQSRWHHLAVSWTTDPQRGWISEFYIDGRPSLGWARFDTGHGRFLEADNADKQFPPRPWPIDEPKGEFIALLGNVLDATGKPFVGLTLADCSTFAGDSTRARISWKGDLASHADKPVRIRFHLTEGELYAFWITSDEHGTSGGYVAGGGPKFRAGRDQ